MHRFGQSSSMSYSSALLTICGFTVLYIPRTYYYRIYFPFYLALAFLFHYIVPPFPRLLAVFPSSPWPPKPTCAHSHLNYFLMGIKGSVNKTGPSTSRQTEKLIPPSHFIYLFVYLYASKRRGRGSYEVYNCDLPPPCTRISRGLCDVLLFRPIDPREGERVAASCIYGWRSQAVCFHGDAGSSVN